jgi:hypothetical protein
MVRIPLRSRTGEVRAYALVDAIDQALAEGCRWSLHSDGYAYRQPVINGRKTTLFLHRVVMGVQPHDGQQVDHRNGDRLDCRRSNLRIVTHAEQRQNVARNPDRRGVYFARHRNKWYAQVKHRGKHHTAPYRGSREEAVADARELRARVLTHAVEDRH